MKIREIEIQDFEYISSCIDIRKLEGKSFFITGANGFIASYFIKYLLFLNEYILQKKCNITVLCRSREKFTEKFQSYNIDKIYVLEQDIIDQINYNYKIDFIIHAASIASSLLFSSKPVDVSLANSVGTYQVMELARKVKASSILFFSSGAVYGEMPNISNSKISEKMYYNLAFNEISNCYAESKRFGEQLMMDYFSQYDLASKIVRISHTYGPGIDLKDGHVYSDFVNAIIHNENLNLKSDGTAVRPFCYIADTIVALILILLKGINGRTYNLANTKCYLSIYQLAMLLVDKVVPEKGLKVIRECEPNCEHIEYPKLDIGELKTLGWEPKIDVENGFLRTIKSFE